ncbi:hypothetical protein HPB47_000510 [Ixodes persulcatus]|uniref:Uncharacterized protein n=1 Tax=Ixodes persulcatus TaxID=34615 RepID=A0AC60PRK8_IXOPE|nr:hypothetical protein HPB47_000510 [Ixodes persulcatus]
MDERRRPASQSRYIPSILTGRMRAKSSKASMAEEKEIATEPSHISTDSAKKSQKKMRQVFHYYFTRKNRRKSTGSPSQCSTVSGISAVSAISPTTAVPPIVTLEGFSKDLVIRNPSRKFTERTLGFSAPATETTAPSHPPNDDNVQDKGVGDLVLSLAVGLADSCHNHQPFKTSDLRTDHPGQTPTPTRIWPKVEQVNHCGWRPRSSAQRNKDSVHALYNHPVHAYPMGHDIANDTMISPLLLIQMVMFTAAHGLLFSG